MWYAVCGMQYVVCIMWYAVCVMWYAVCSMVYVVCECGMQYVVCECGVRYVVCGMWHAVCGMRYAVCCMWYANVVCDMRYVVCDVWYVVCSILYVVCECGMQYAVCGMRYAERKYDGGCEMCFLLSIRTDHSIDQSICHPRLHIHIQTYRSTTVNLPANPFVTVHTYENFIVLPQWETRLQYHGLISHSVTLSGQSLPCPINAEYQAR